MGREDWVIFLGSATNNKFMVAAHAFSGFFVVGATVAIGVLIALYFGIDIFGFSEGVGGFLFSGNKNIIVIFALVCSIALLVARISQVVIEARVVVEREKWFADRIRRKKVVVDGNVSRASNYYGRLSSSSMKAVSNAFLLLVSFIVMVVLLPFYYAVGMVVFLLFFAVGLFFAMRNLSRFISSSSRRLAENGKKMAAWKQDGELPYTDDVDVYYKAYFDRIFVSSVFGVTPAAFSFLICLSMVFVQGVGGINFEFEEMFLTIVLLQSLVGILGGVFGSLVQASAFLPAIKDFLSIDGLLPGF